LKNVNQTSSQTAAQGNYAHDRMTTRNKRAPARTIEQLPLFADDDSIGEAVLGPERATEFKGIATLLEPQGMPKISPLFGGRYTRGVKMFLDGMQGLAAGVVPLKEDGREGSWSNKTDRKARA
jgi:hypothetical protein